MIRIVFYTLTIVVLASCARMPYNQWNERLSILEQDILSQKNESNGIAQPDVILYNGVYNATKTKDVVPYPELGKIAGGLESSNKNVQSNSEERLIQSEAYRAKNLDKSIRTVGPQWTDYMEVLNGLTLVKQSNAVIIESEKSSDIIFDSLCSAHKVKAVPMLDYEVELAEKMNGLEDRFVALSNKYQEFKRGVTKRDDPKASMTQINRMKQKVRQIESEIHQLSNLYSRVSSLRADAMMFEGPGITPMAEISSITQKTAKISGFLSELNKLVESY